jgi:hypothetical protein
MWEMRRRTENTFWSNDTPIIDLHEGLDAIGGQKTYLYTGHDLVDKTRPEIRQDFSEDNGSGGHRNPGITYLEIDPELVKRLIAEALVTPIRTPNLGFTKTVKDRLVLSLAGWERRVSLHEEKKLLAQNILGTEGHQVSNGVVNFRHGRKHRGRWGEIYFDFKTPSGEKVRVFPDNGKVEEIEKKKVLLDATEDDN